VGSGFALVDGTKLIDEEHEQPDEEEHQRPGEQALRLDEVADIVGRLCGHEIGLADQIAKLELRELGAHNQACPLTGLLGLDKGLRPGAGAGPQHSGVEQA